MRRLFRATAVALVAALCLVVPDFSYGEDASPETRALFDAVIRNDLDAVRTTIADGARIESRSSFGQRPVDLAIERGHYEIAHYLLSLHNVRESANAAAKKSAPPTAPEIRKSDAPDGDDLAAASSSLPPPPPLSAEPPPSPANVSPGDRLAPPGAPVKVEPAMPREIDLRVTPTPPPPSPAETRPAATQHTAENGKFLDRAASRIRQIAGSFEETFDTFLGGWFFRWIGRHVAWNDQPETPDRSIAVADLVMPDEAATSLAAPDAAPLPAPLEAIESAETRTAEAAPSAAPPTQQMDPAVVASLTKGDSLPAGPEVSSEPAAPSAATAETPTDEPPARPLAASGPAGQKVPAAPPKVAAAERSPAPPSSQASSKGVAAPRKEESLPKAAMAAADPFAPEAVAPGTRHPIIGAKPPVVPLMPLRDEPATAFSSRPSPVVTSSDKSVTRPPTPATPERRVSMAGEAEPTPATAGDTKRAKPAGNPEGLLDQFAEIQKPAKTRPARPKDDRPLGLQGPAGGGTGSAGTAMLSVPGLTRKAPASVLTLGDSVYITAAMPPDPADPSERNYCVRKDRGAVIFCVEPVDWPTRLGSKLRVNSIMYQGAQAIVRYDNGLATRMHAIFPTASYDALIAHYTHRFGKPTATSERTIAPFAQPRQSNQVVSWQRLDPLTNKRTTLEIRQYDDTRGGFPDMRYGAVMLYNTASPPIFPILSTLDLMPTAAD